jgi:hypothetical protein
MKINKYPTMVAAVEGLQERGYDSDFQLAGESMKCLTNNKMYHSEDMVIVEYHRFEGISNPDDMSIIFAVECNDGTKGTIVSSYGVYGDVSLLDFIDKVKIKEQQHEQQDQFHEVQQGGISN